MFLKVIYLFSKNKVPSKEMNIVFLPKIVSIQYFINCGGDDFKPEKKEFLKESLTM